MFVLNSQFTSATATTAPAATAAAAALAKRTPAHAHIRQQWKRLMLSAFHLHSHWAIIIDSAEANKVWFDVLSGLCSIFFLFTLQWCEALLFFLSYMIHMIAYAMISSCVSACVWRTYVWAKKLYLRNHSEKVWTTLNRINDPSMTNVFRSKFEISTPKNSIMPLSFCRAYSFSFALNEVKMGKSIVHAKLANGQRKKGRKEEWENGREMEVCMCLCGKSHEGNNARLLSRLGCRFTSLFFGLFRII